VPNRKIRTREHIIADISENDFERIALMKGFSTESTFHDYGYDILLSTYDKSGEIENGFVLVQLKATDKLPLIKNGTVISFPVDRRDLDLWLNEFYPVILVVYDAQKKKGYWLYVQEYFKLQPRFSIEKVKSYVNVHIPVENKISKGAMTKFKRFKEKRYKLIQNL